MLIHFVEHARIPLFKARGWKLHHLLTDCHHGEHGVIMVRRPRRGEKAEDIMGEMRELAA